ncbi:MAG TPA: hypothetical protein VHO67_08975 [Polyangia bacterium]|nr:hypothetical protein [Polyangia bacterium]
MALFGCAGVKQTGTQTGSGGSSTTGAGGSTGRGGSSSTGTGGTITPTGCVGQCTDFEPTASNPNPMFDQGVSSDIGSKFGNPSGNPPCVSEPEDGALYPNNWAPLRVRVPGNTGNLKITLHADMESTDMVAYSAPGETWTMPKPLWASLASHIVEQDITVTVQTMGGGAAKVKFQIAAVGAGGSMVFWSADPKQSNKMSIEAMTTNQASLVNDSYLSGFTVGDVGTTKALTIDQVQQYVLTNDQHNTRNSRCIGCHVGTPDGSYVAFVDAWPWPAVLANVSPDPALHGQALPNYLGCHTTNFTMACPTTAGATGIPTTIQYAWGGPMAFSKAHWADPATSGERIGIMASQMVDFNNPYAQDNASPGQLMWIDFNSTATSMANNGLQVPVKGTAYGYLSTGDTTPPKKAAGFPNWSADGNTVVYVSAACPNPGQSNPNGTVGQGCGSQDGRLASGPSDIYQVPYNNKAGGTASPVPGASSSSLDEYYPALSPDQSFLAFTAVPSPGYLYANKSAEMYVTPFGSAPGAGADAKAVRLTANDPPACTGKKSPGINNHWPRWSPTVGSSGQKTYYWLIFSSNRYGTPPQPDATGHPVEVSQLYITAVVVSGEFHQVATYPAIYLYNQDSSRLNTTPAWQDFNIPIVIDRP